MEDTVYEILSLVFGTLLQWKTMYMRFWHWFPELSFNRRQSIGDFGIGFRNSLSMEDKVYEILALVSGTLFQWKTKYLRFLHWLPEHSFNGRQSI